MYVKDIFKPWKNKIGFINSIMPIGTEIRNNACKRKMKKLTSVIIENSSIFSMISASKENIALN